jgi:hypothetical protein
MQGWAGWVVSQVTNPEVTSAPTTIPQRPHTGLQLHHSHACGASLLLPARPSVPAKLNPSFTSARWSSTAFSPSSTVWLARLSSSSRTQAPPRTAASSGPSALRNRERDTNRDTQTRQQRFADSGSGQVSFQGEGLVS